MLPAFAVLSEPASDRALLLERARTLGRQQQLFWTTARAWEAGAGAAAGSVQCATGGQKQAQFLAEAGAKTEREGKQKLR